MTKVLEYLRANVSPDTREKLYMAAALVVATVGSKAQLDESTQTAILAVVATSIGFLFAVLNSTGAVVASLYALVGAVAALGQLWATTTDTDTWVGWIGLGLAIAGQLAAVLRSPTGTTVLGSVVDGSVTDELLDAGGVPVRQWGRSG